MKQASTIMKHQELTIGLILLLVCNLLFAVRELAAKAAFMQLVSTNTFLVIYAAFLIPGTLAIIASHVYKEGWQHFTLFNVGWALAAGVLCYDLGMTVDLLGLRHVPVAIERSLSSVYPAFIYLGALLLYKKAEPPFRIFSVSFVIIYVGILAIFVDGYRMRWHEILSSQYSLGAAYVLVSALLTALFFLIGERVISRAGAQFFAGIALFSASVMLVIQGLLVQPLPVLVSQFNNAYGLALLATFCTLVSGYLLSVGIHYMGAAYSGLIAAISPMFVIILAFFVLGESVSSFQLLGISIICFGLAVLWRTTMDTPR